MMMLAAMLLTSAPAVATPQQQAQAPSAAPSTLAEKKERKICKNNPKFTGTRVVETICLTKSEWARLAAEQSSQDGSN